MEERERRKKEITITKATVATGNVCECEGGREIENAQMPVGRRKRASSHTFGTKASTLEFVSPARTRKRRS